MRLILPPHVSAAQFDRALAAFARIVGAAHVYATDQDRDTYIDAYALGDGSDHVASAALAPGSVEEVQAILRTASEHRIPLWPVSRGKNLGYGHAAPLVSGSVVMDLGRMKRILEVDERHGYAVIEPGVGFFDLYEHLRDNGIPLWMSVPGNAWGSVLGNALERGLGYTPYGDNTAKLCGLEVVLPDGGIVRTGMGALGNSRSWHLYPYGFGPHWDQVFVQSNFGVVVKAGIWLMPEPEATAKVQIDLPEPEDIGWAIDALARLRLTNVIDSPMVFGNYLHNAAIFSRRSEWYTGPGAIPDEVSRRIIEHYGTGWWSTQVRLYGHEKLVEARAELVRQAFEPRLGKKLDFQTWKRGEPLEKSAISIPTVVPLAIVDWHGGRGGHIGFSPVMPPEGDLALAAFRKMKRRFEEFGLDYYTSFTIGHRHINNINLILYDRDDAGMTAQARALFQAMAADAAADGYAEYRTHPDFMQLVADTYDFNGHALRGLAERVKDALDPAGILAPGKNGIWPKSWREGGR
jgi:4-cresol dehydrogenase (hydroxylating)